MTIDGHTSSLSVRVVAHSNTDAPAAGAGAPPEYPLAVMRKRFRLLQHFAAGLLALMLAFAPAAPAQAGLYDCVNAAFPVEGLADAAKLAAGVAQCTGQLAGGDAVMAAAVATMTALAIAGVIPTDTDQCYAAIDQVIGKLMAEALQQAGLADALGLSQSDMDQLISGQVSLHQLANTIPAVQLLLNYVNCGCKIVGAPDAAKEIAENYLADAKGCAAFFEDALGSVLDWIEGGICDALDTIGLGCRAAGGGDQTCYMSGSEVMDVEHAGAPPSGHCELGMQCNNCGWSWCSYIDAHAFGIAPGVCACPAPFTSNRFSETNNRLKSCTCDPPNMAIAGGCVCPVNQQLKEGVCVACSANETYVPAQTTMGQSGAVPFESISQYPKCQSCPLGMKANADHTGCVNACDNAAGEIFDGGVCKKCGYGAGATYVAGSLGFCCAPGQKADAKHTKCEPACAQGQILDLATLTCKGCAAGSVAVTWNPSVSIGTCEKCPAGLTSLAGKCVCPINTYAQSSYTTTPGGTVIKDVKCSPIPPVKELSKTPLNLACSPGMIQIADVGCMCPSGSRWDGDKCIPLAVQNIPARKDCSALGPNFINNPKNATQCIRCGGGRVANEARTACVAKPGLQRTTPPITGERTFRRTLECPPRMIPNARGTACIRQLNVPPFRTPGSLRPGGDRRVPAFGRLPTRR